jgi:putative ABC transport system permease protein
MQRARAEIPDFGALARRLGRVERPHSPPQVTGAGGAGRITSLIQDFRYAARDLRSWKGSPAAIALLGVTLAAVLTVVAAAESWLFPRYPFAGTDRLVLLWGTNRANGQVRDVISGPTFLDLQDRAVGFERLAAFAEGELTIRRDGKPSLLGTLRVTPEFFHVLALQPAAGRTLRPDDLGAPSVMISHEVWRAQFGGDPAVVGRTLTALGQPHEIVGVLPEGFRLLDAPDAVTLLDPRELRKEPRTYYYYWVVGRLRAGVSVAEAQSDLDGVFAQLGREHLQVQGWSATVDDFRTALADPVRPSLQILIVIAGLVLLIGAGNCVNLVTSRSLARRRDMAIRTALGATPSRIRRQWLFEGALIATGGMLLGVVTTIVAVNAGMSYTPSSAFIRGSAATIEFPPIEVGRAVAIVAVMVAALVGVLLGAVAARGAGQLDLRGGFTPPARLTRERRWLLAGQSAIATLLTAVCGILLVMVARLWHTSPGFDANQVMVVGIGGIHELDARARVRYYAGVVDAVSAVPGVTAAALNDYVPLTNEDDYEGFEIPGRPRDGTSWPREEWRRVSGAYFSTLNIPIVSGRGLTGADDERTPSVVVINEALANKYWPGQNPVGQHIRITNGHYGWSEVVGIAGDVREVSLDSPAKPMMFVPYHRDPRPVMALFVRTVGRTETSMAQLRSAIWSVDATRPLFGAHWLEDVVGESYAVPRAVLIVTGALAVIALLLIAGGTYAVVALVTLARTRELALRVAIGAAPMDIAASVLATPWAWAAAGIAAGLGAAVLAARAVASQLTNVPALDAPIAAAASVIVALVIAGACLLPLLRAWRTDVALMLRSE